MPSRLLLAIIMLSASAWSVESFNFAVIGDHFEEPPKGLIENLVAQKPAAVVGTGDTVARSNLKDFEDFKKVVIEPLKKIGAEYYPCMGNHDFPIVPNWARMWGEEKGKNYYSFDLKNAHLIVLDTNKASAPDGTEYKAGTENFFIQRQAKDFKKESEQYKWLVADLEKTRQKHVFVFMHFPAMSYGGHYGSPLIQSDLCPLFEKHKVTAVFMGHSHGYERFNPIRIDLSSGKPVPTEDKVNGVVYVVTAAGMERGNLYDIKQNPLHASLKKAANFVIVTIEDDTVKFKTLEPPNATVIDTWEIKSRR